MKFQRSTVILVAIALLLGGVVLFTQARQSGGNRPTTAQGDAETSPVFDFEEEDVVYLRIETAAQTVVFEKDAEGFWQMIEPEAQPAEEAAIAFLLSRLVTDGLRQTTTIEAANQAEFGLEDPFATVEITLADDTTHTLILGDPDFSGQNYYALVDPENFPLPAAAGEVEVAIVTENILNGVDRPLEEWQAVIDEPAPTTEDADTEDDAADADGDTSETETDDADDTASEAIDEPQETAPDDNDDADADGSGDPDDGAAADESGTNSEDIDSDAENSDTTDEADTPQSVAPDDKAVKTLSASETQPINVPVPSTSDTSP